MNYLQKIAIATTLLFTTTCQVAANDDATWVRPDSFLIPVDTIYEGHPISSYEATEIKFPDVSPKSPEASAFQKYGESEINEYTGNPAISIPLYNLSYKGIEIPISLTYDGGGIQVAQEASWVGLGWSLNVGGCINYVCQGSNDQWLGRHGSWEKDYYRILNSNPAPYFKMNSNFAEVGFVSDTQSDNIHEMLQDLKNGQAEFDYYSVNILGHSFLFFKDPYTNEYKIIGASDDVYKIKELDNKEWEIIDVNGISYTFSEKEYSKESSWGDFISAWYLTQITIPSGGYIYFDYSKPYSYSTLPSYSQYYDLIKNYKIISLAGTVAGFPDGGIHSKLTSSVWGIDKKYLSAITTDDQTIKISLGMSSRKDLPGAQKLDDLSVSSPLTGQIIKKYQFDQQLWYDDADNVMFSQDGEMRKKGVYMFYLYDNLMRQVVLGTTSAINNSCRSALVSYQGGYAGLFSSGYVPTEKLGLVNAQLFLANYYDNHSFLNRQLVKQNASQDLATTLADTKESYSKGALTGTISRTTDGKFLVSAINHNKEGLVVETRQTMPNDALLCQSTNYSFTKKPLTIETQVKKGEIDKSITQKNRYNQYNDKIESITLNAGNGDKEVALYRYDDIGRLVSVKRSGNAGTIANEYNIRNWLTSTTSGRFRESLKYESGSKSPCYNGNISRMQWQITYDNVLRGYDFEYDGLNRLTTSAYAEGTDMNQNKDRYSESIPQYSPNGSIERLQRYGKKNNGTFGLIDDLTYQYNGNQIRSISDKAESLLYDGSFDFKDGANESTEYFYNANGALTKDHNKGISQIEYDMLDNISCITFNNGFKTKYVYDASGNKLRTVHEALTTNTTDYIGDFIFEDGKLSKYQFEGGYCSFDSDLNPTYHYYEKDHLGSVRMVVNENSTIEQINHYYPFGGVYGDLSYNSELQRNKYIGKEFDHTSGLDWYDHGARMYDAAKGSWDKIDKLAEKYYGMTPYAYSKYNPVKYLDIDGLKPRIYIETNGLGHTFVTVGEGKNTIVYTYGRYGALGSSGSILHGFTPTGEGVLIRKSGKQAINYINKKLEDGNLSIYTLEKGNDNDVASFFNNMWNRGRKVTNTGKKTKNDPNAKVVDEYNLMDNNCTTKTIEGVNYRQSIPLVPAEETTTMQDFGGSYNYKNKIISPSQLKRMLDEVSRKHPNNIVKVKNPQEFINNLQ